jgi:hypothetical protein
VLPSTQRIVYAKQVKARFLKLFRPRAHSEYKQMLAELVDAQIARYSALVQEHEARAEQQAERTFDRLTVDLSPEGTAEASDWVDGAPRLNATVDGHEAGRPHETRENWTNELGGSTPSSSLRNEQIAIELTASRSRIAPPLRRAVTFQGAKTTAKQRRMR